MNGDYGEDGGMTGGQWDTCDLQALTGDGHILTCRRTYGHKGAHRGDGHMWAFPIREVLDGPVNRINGGGGA